MDIQASEYLYQDHLPDQGDYWSFRYRIIKKTKSRVYVSRDFERGPGIEADNVAIVLDREQLENNGWAAHQRKGTFYTAPNYRLAN